MRALVRAAGPDAHMSADEFDDFIATQLDRYYSRLLARAYMSASGQRNVSGNLKGEQLADAFTLAATRLLSDAELSFSEFVEIFETMISNVASRRSSTAVAAHLESELPDEPDIIFPKIIAPDIILPTPSIELPSS